MTAPLIHAEINGKSKTLFMTSVEQMREATKPHLRMTLQGKITPYLRFKENRFVLGFFSELGLTNGTEMLVGDPARATTMRVILSLTSSMETSTTK